MSEFIHAPEEFTTTDLPTVFLAGPVQGARDWQSDLAGKLLQSGYQMGIGSVLADLPDPTRRALF